MNVSVSGAGRGRNQTRDIDEFAFGADMLFDVHLPAPRSRGMKPGSFCVLPAGSRLRQLCGFERAIDPLWAVSGANSITARRRLALALANINLTILNALPLARTTAAKTPSPGLIFCD
jgi:hypothetical protein